MDPTSAVFVNPLGVPARLLVDSILDSLRNRYATCIRVICCIVADALRQAARAACNGRNTFLSGVPDGPGRPACLT
jgi:hypothetical protein